MLNYMGSTAKEKVILTLLHLVYVFYKLHEIPRNLICLGIMLSVVIPVIILKSYVSEELKNR